MLVIQCTIFTGYHNCLLISRILFLPIFMYVIFFFNLKLVDVRCYDTTLWPERFVVLELFSATSIDRGRYQLEWFTSKRNFCRPYQKQMCWISSCSCMDNDFLICLFSNKICILSLLLITNINIQVMFQLKIEKLVISEKLVTESL